MAKKNSNMVKITYIALAIIVFNFVLILHPSNVCATNTANDLRGRWDFFVEGLGENLEYFTVYIGDLKFDKESDTYLATGCMESPSKILSPLALKALDEGNGSYNVSLISTVVPDNGAPFVCQFFGPIHTFGNGVPDDIAGGDESIVRTEFLNDGKWTAAHHDRRRKECPPVEIPPLSFWVDVRAQHNLRGGQVELIKTIFDVQTDIASSGVLVEKPDGSKVTLPQYTDIFSPDVDFVSRFRYVIPYDEADESDPIAGEPYYFTLLDIFGNPIPGSTKTDIWTGCYISAPSNFVPNVLSNKNVNIEWDAVAKVDGFDPANGVGFYQIEIGGWNPWTPDIYGSNLIKSIKHEVPWDDFVPPSPGNPDGFDLGVGLNRFTDGIYVIRVEAFSEPPSGSGGQSLECVVVDFDQNIFFQKSADNITFIPPQP